MFLGIVVVPQGVWGLRKEPSEVQMPREQGREGVGHRHANHHDEAEDIEGEHPRDGRDKVGDDGHDTQEG